MNDNEKIYYYGKAVELVMEAHEAFDADIVSIEQVPIIAEVIYKEGIDKAKEMIAMGEIYKACLVMGFDPLEGILPEDE